METLGGKLTLLHHPNAGPLEIAFLDGEVKALAGDFLHHSAEIADIFSGK